MDTPEVPAQVLEIDGPPMAYIELEGPDQVHVQLHYRTIACIGDTEESVLAWLNEQVDMVRAACRVVEAFIIWRTRPHAEKRPGRGKRWIARARLITSHPISEDVWKAMQVQEGEPVGYVAP